MVVIGTASLLSAIRAHKSPCKLEPEITVCDPDRLADKIRGQSQLLTITILPAPIGFIPSLFYIENFVSDVEQCGLLAQFESQTWIELKRRRLQQFGGQPQPDGLNPEPLPNYLHAITDRVCSFGVFPESQHPNHILVNQYKPGEGIMAHTDGPLYLPCVAILSLGSGAIMSFYRSLADASSVNPDLQVYLRPKSLLIFRDSLYSDYFHQIEACKYDNISSKIVNAMEAQVEPGNVYQRSTRTSLTIRHVNENRYL